MLGTKNKRGSGGIILFFLLLLTILIVGVIAVVSTSILDYSSGIITPIAKDLGVVGETNISQAAEYTFGTLDTTINALPWLVAFGYVAMLIFSIIFVVSWTVNPNPVLLGVFVIFTFLLVLGAIIMSNIYQDIYSGNDVIAEGLQSQKAMSYLILYSPMIMTAIAFIAGVYIFAGKQNELQGGFDG